MSKIDFTKREILKYVGDFTQVFGIKEYTLSGGKAQGVRAVDVKSGSGLEFTVLPDRCMDIAWLSYKGNNLSYISKTGIVSPQYYNETGFNFLRSFYAGFLTTCGLMNVGSPCIDGGEAFGQHGRISNTPGENVSSTIEWEKDQPVMKLKGRMREAKVFGENVVLDREITCRAGENKITIENTIENYGFRREPLMLLFHFNLGYPLLDEDAVFVIPTKEVRPANEEAKKGVKDYNVFQKPTPDYMEQVFYHDLKTDSQGNTCAALINERLGLGVVIRFNKGQLTNFTQWKQMGEGEYVLGIEPCNCFVEGRAQAKADRSIKYIEPGEVKSFNIEIEILDGNEHINKVKDGITRI
ncbi:MAG: aldose 1-epimerase family protein [Mahellales bacterium]|jgi:hypothetical protein